MTPPLVSYSTFNRLGLTARSLNALLKTTDDFELHIIDNNSKDDTWDFINSLNDPRIMSKTRFPVNAGPIYAVNYSLQKRRPDQYFITFESDVYIKTADWVTRFLRVFQAFPELGLLGLARAWPYPAFLPETVYLERDGISCLQLKNGKRDVPLDFVPGHCQCLKPELINMIGHWNEEDHYGDAELSVRICNYTPFKAAFANDVDIDMLQSIPCEYCECAGYCKLDRSNGTCFDVRNRYYKNEQFAETFRWKHIEYFNELDQGKRTVYCASIHNPESISTHTYNMAWAQENFNFYITNAN